MGNKQSYFDEDDLEDYQTLTFLTRQEILKVAKRFLKLTQAQRRNGNIKEARLSKKHALKMAELRENPFNDRIVKVFSSDGGHSLSFEDFLDMMSVFSERAPKSVKIAYAFKIYQGISHDDDTDDEDEPAKVIDLEDVKEVISRLSDPDFDEEYLTDIARTVIKEVDLPGNEKLTEEIFEYFLSNVADFPSLFVIKLADE